MMKAKDTVLELYLLKRIEARVKGAIASRKEVLMGRKPAVPAEIVDSTLKVTFTDVAGRKSFDAEKAEAFLKAALPKREFDLLFTEYVIERKGSEEPPKELMAELSKYFRVKKVSRISEQTAKRAPLDDAQIAEGCYSRGDGYIRMNTPTKISDQELIQMMHDRKLSMVDTLLLEGDA